MRAFGVFLAVFLGFATSASAEGLAVVAAENFYGDLARQIGGSQARVTSVLANPDQDPHLFEASASVAKSVAEARIVILNGLGYDSWMERLLAIDTAQPRRVIEAAKLMQAAPGSNPHLWYDPKTAPAMTAALAKALEEADPAHKADYEARLAAFTQALQPLQDKIASMKAAFPGLPIAATEPIFGLMAQALGLNMRHERFQFAVMNGVEPGASDLAALERDLRERKVKVLIYNSQASSGLTERLKSIAGQGNVPVVGVTETEPEGVSYQDWMLQELTALETALKGAL